VFGLCLMTHRPDARSAHAALQNRILTDPRHVSPDWRYAEVRDDHRLRMLSCIGRLLYAQPMSRTACILLNRLLDGLDGAVARAVGSNTTVAPSSITALNSFSA
jgi:phosphatidylglycerophosphate synthase